MPAPRRNWGCKSCHFIWYGRDGQLIIGCAHCPKVSQKIDFAGGEDLLQRQILGSQRGHKEICGRPIR